MGAPSGGVARMTMAKGGGNHNANLSNIQISGEYPTTLRPDTYDTVDSNENTTITKASTSCDIYISLIQQYIAVFQIENALFFAERCIADYPNSYEAIYMQALCYYRLHKFKNARACILSKQQTIFQQHQVLMQQQEYISTAKVAPSSSTSGGYNNYSTICSMLYLSAQCSYELGDFPAAEATLIQTTRDVFQQQHPTTNNNNGMSMDEWILQSTVRKCKCMMKVLP